jgi:hypothetical protein
MSQEKRALRYFQTHKRGLTALDFWVKLGIYRAADTVYKLRRKGYNIVTTRIKVKNQYGEECNVALYTMEA